MAVCAHPDRASASCFCLIPDLRPTVRSKQPHSSRIAPGQLTWALFGIKHLFVLTQSSGKVATTPDRLLVCRECCQLARALIIADYYSRWLTRYCESTMTYMSTFNSDCGGMPVTVQKDLKTHINTVVTYSLGLGGPYWPEHEQAGSERCRARDCC